MTTIKSYTDINQSRKLAEILPLESAEKVSIWKHWKDGIAGNGEGKPIFLIKIGNRYNLSSCLSTKCDYIELSELDNLVLEKQFEQKSFDYESANIQQKDFAPKQEPKFKVSEWIIWYGNCYKIYYNECGYELIDQNGLSTSLEYTTVDENAHLWTIKDAKDGDILSTKSGRPFIFKDFSDAKHPNNPTGYCGINTLDNFIIGSGTYWWTDEEVYPATKEQCDSLMKAMNKAGYEWDIENKELKCIEQTSTSRKEDEHRIKATIYFLNRAKNHFTNTLELDTCINWLKSLKERITK